MRTKICNGYLCLREIDLSVDHLHYLRTKLYTKIKISSKKKVEYILTKEVIRHHQSKKTDNTLAKRKRTKRQR